MRKISYRISRKSCDHGQSIAVDPGETGIQDLQFGVLTDGIPFNKDQMTSSLLVFAPHCQNNPGEMLPDTEGKGRGQRLTKVLPGTFCGQLSR